VMVRFPRILVPHDKTFSRRKTVLEVLYHRAEFAEARKSHAAGDAKNVEVFFRTRSSMLFALLTAKRIGTGAPALCFEMLL